MSIMLKTYQDFLLNINLKGSDTVNIKELAKEIDEIKEHGFSEMEAIELLKVAELRELNKQLQDTLYISGDVTCYQGIVG